MEIKLEDIIPGTSQESIRQHIKVKLVCKWCCNYIENIIINIDGVEYVHCSNQTGFVIVSFNPSKTSLDKIEQVISDGGFDTPRHKRKIEFYFDRPKCCKYTKRIPI